MRLESLCECGSRVFRIKVMNSFFHDWNFCALAFGVMERAANVFTSTKVSQPSRRFGGESRGAARSSVFYACNRAFRDCLKTGAETGADDIFEINFQKLIPDGLIGRFGLDAPFDYPPNRLDGCETFVEVKTLATLSMTPSTRAHPSKNEVS